MNSLPQIFDLNGKVALVAGCGSVGEGWGNGKAISVLLARHGAAIFGIDHNAATAGETESLIKAEDGTCVAHTADLTDRPAALAAIAACMERFGRIDILINNVGGTEPGGPADMDEDVWDRQFALNLDIAYRTIGAVLPGMIERGGGAIVNISSTAGLRYTGKPQIAYAAAKAGLLQMTRTTAVIHAASGVRLNCVAPGLIDTPLVKLVAHKWNGGDYVGLARARAERVPMGRMGSAWDVAHAALFLASDEAGYVTGTEIVVDGGLIATTP